MNNSFKYILAEKEGFKGTLLDVLLAAGYYRMQHLMFTCNETAMGDNQPQIPVFWLRINLSNCRPQNSAKKILKHCDGFLVETKEAELTTDVLQLYDKYKKHITFKVADAPEDYLHHPYLEQPFDSMMIKVYDGAQLVAAGFFDKGQTTIAGIMNVYDPAYKSFSLGKFLILQKLQYALHENMLYYYTGYISTQSTRFDYKIFPDAEAIEVFLPLEKIWLPYQNLGKSFLQNYYAKHFRLLSDL